MIPGSYEECDNLLTTSEDESSKRRPCKTKFKDESTTEFGNLYYSRISNIVTVLCSCSRCGNAPTKYCNIIILLG